MSRKQRKYSPEFRADAVKLARSSDQTVAQTAKDLDIPGPTLHMWVSRAEVDVGEREGLNSDERAEMTKLKAENRKLKAERDFLKKAAAFFARDSETP